MSEGFPTVSICELFTHAAIIVCFFVWQQLGKFVPWVIIQIMHVICSMVFVDIKKIK